MFGMLLPVLCATRSQFFIMDDEQILTVVLLSSLSEVEGPCDRSPSINGHHFMMGYGMFRIHFDAYSNTKKKSGQAGFRRIQSIFLHISAFRRDHAKRFFLAPAQRYLDISPLILQSVL
jgi:hypothetical protein